MMFKKMLTEAMSAELQEFIKKMPKFAQRQDSTNDQLRDLRDVANKLGMYDAADVIKTILRNHK